MPGPEELLEHAAGCADPTRTEVFSDPAGSHSLGRTIRRLACSASWASFIPEPEPEEIEAQQRGKAPPDVRLPGQHDRPDRAADVAVDALDAGANGDYPYLPRNPADGSLDTSRMPVGTRRQLMPDGRTVVLVYVERTGPDGRRPSEIPPPAT